MTDEIGGGASRSTDPAAGSSAATDVSLREYFGSLIHSLDRFVTAEIAALRRETGTANQVAERAITVAADEAKERLASHNGLIEQMRVKDEGFATKTSLVDYKEAADLRFGRLEKFQAMIVGALILVSGIGVANVVKVWGPTTHPVVPTEQVVTVTTTVTTSTP